MAAEAHLRRTLMAPLIVVGLIAVIAILGWRGVKSEQKRVSEALKRARRDADRRAPLTLEKDPRTGVYRARED
jgi:hypothetical protein